MKSTTECDVEEDPVETTQPTKNVVTGKDFTKLTKKALKAGATSLDYSNRKIVSILLRSTTERRHISGIPSMRIICFIVMKTVVRNILLELRKSRAKLRN